MNENNSNECVYFTLLYSHSAVFFFLDIWNSACFLKWSAPLCDDAFGETSARSGEQAVHTGTEIFMMSSGGGGALTAM